MTTTVAVWQGVLLSAVLATVRGIHSPPATSLANQSPLIGQDAQNQLKRSFSWSSLGGDNNVNVVVQRWQSGTPLLGEPGEPWGQSWSWSWNGAANSPLATQGSTRGFEPNPRLDVRQLNSIVGAVKNRNTLPISANDVRKSVQKVQIPSFTRSHLKADSLSIQKALTDIVSAWVRNGGKMNNNMLTSGRPSVTAKPTVKPDQRRRPVEKPVDRSWARQPSVNTLKDTSVSRTMAKIKLEPPKPIVQTPIPVTQAPRGRVRERHLLPPAVYLPLEPTTRSVAMDNSLAYTNTLDKGRTKQVSGPDIAAIINKVKMPLFNSRHLRANSQTIQRALLEAVLGWSGSIPGTSDSAGTTTVKATPRKPMNESPTRVLPTMNNQWDVPPPITIPTNERRAVKPPVAVRFQPPRKQQILPKPSPGPPPPPIPLSSTARKRYTDRRTGAQRKHSTRMNNKRRNSRVHIATDDVFRPVAVVNNVLLGLLRDDAIPAAIPRTEVRDAPSKRRGAFIIPISILDQNLPPRVLRTQPKPSVSARQSSVRDRWRKTAARPTNPSDAFLTDLLFSAPGLFPLNLNMDRSRMVPPRRGGASRSIRRRGFSEEPGEEPEF